MVKTCKKYIKEHQVTMCLSMPQCFVNISSVNITVISDKTLYFHTKYSDSIVNLRDRVECEDGAKVILDSKLCPEGEGKGSGFTQLEGRGQGCAGGFAFIVNV